MTSRTEEHWETEVAQLPSNMRFVIVDDEIILLLDGHPHAFAQDATLKTVLRRQGVLEGSKMSEVLLACRHPS